MGHGVPLLAEATLAVSASASATWGQGGVRQLQVWPYRLPCETWSAELLCVLDFGFPSQGRFCVRALACGCPIVL